MAIKPKKKITDEEILAMTEVPAMIAADYLGMTYSMLTWKLQQGELPIGTARKNKAWAYHISPQALVKYKHGEGENSLLQAIHNQLADIQKQLPEICMLLQEYQKGATT